MPDLLLTFRCGCVERFGPVSAIQPDWPENMPSSNLCPADCQDCASHGRTCPDRERDDLSKYRPIDFQDIRPELRRRGGIKLK